ncbi:AT-rich interactive domain-containing protein 2-like [Zingiber officinale]|uniref:AT-rich interactive domain-containing protein 2-like n=1 Tax=Zingiber officinale TaxID=94328 RepID=UPI001C4D701B|nr:AT-rich interactive domain-containing protein 2-like [Zingiber officinale]
MLPFPSRLTSSLTPSSCRSGGSMGGVYICEDGVALDPLLISGCAAHEGEEYKEKEKEVVGGLFFHRIPSASPLSGRPSTPQFHQFFPAPSPEPLVPDAPDPSLLTPGDDGMRCDAVRVPEGRVAGCEAEKRDSDAGPSGSRTMTRAELASLVTWLRGTAIDPRDRTRAVEKEELVGAQVLRARETLFRTLDDATKLREFPLPPEKKQKVRRHSVGLQKKGKVGSVEKLIQPKRRSERIAQNENENIRHLRTRRKRIGLGSNFQADVPAWMGPPSETSISSYNEDSDINKWVGFLTWPAQEIDREEFDKKFQGETNCCACPSPGSIVCIRSHVSEARFKLKAELGQAFFDWGFDNTGEEVSESWTSEEQAWFDALKRRENESGTSVWQAIPTHFSSKSRRDLINYYFNVYLLRRMSIDSRLTPEYINSDEENHDDEQEEDPKKKRVAVKKKAKFLKTHASDCVDVDRVTEVEEALRSP